jgi:hypothetical protein
MVATSVERATNGRASLSVPGPTPVLGGVMGPQLRLGQSQVPSKHVFPPVQALPQAPQ